MKIHCSNPLHNDSTPSMEVYDNGGYCFSCGWVDKTVSGGKVADKQKEDIDETIRYITSLRTREIRGLELHFDTSGYYIVWPDLSFYKKRLLEGSSRYLGARGYSPPLYLIPGRDEKTVVIVEGELNALSLSVSIGDEYNIASPGSCTNLYTNYYTNYIKYDNIYIIVDKDIPGVVHGLKLKELLLKHNKRVQLIAVKTDYNDLLVQGGKDSVKEAFKYETDLEV